MIHKTFANLWTSLTEALSDTTVSREAYRDSLEEMIDDLEGRLTAVKEELQAEADDGDDLDSDFGDDEETPEDDLDDDEGADEDDFPDEDED